jgi:murein DD-endopeptidase MepM/ murein hydrolase activator NlpD
MRSILNQAKSLSLPHPKHSGLLIGTAAVMMLVVATAFGTAQNTVIYSGEFINEIEQIALPPPLPVMADSELHAREIRIQRGDTVSSLLSALGVDDSELQAFLRQSREAEIMFRQLVPGRTLSAKIDAQGTLYSLAFPLNGGKDNALMIQRTSAGLVAQIKDLRPDTIVSMQTAAINHSLFGAADEAGIPDSIATQLADIFGGDIDFHRDLRKGDRFSVIYETATHMGKPLRTQRILAAEFINDGKTFRAFWYQGRDGVGGYYAADGSSVKKAFLRSPLEFSRISSGFSNARYHPVLRETRAHRGIDYAAPIGTRVKATGDGTVEFVGTQGGYGKVIMIRHPGNKTTVYGHLSGFTPGIKAGTRVSQGDVIGFVGATGLATGPHLHYEFRVAGLHRNPLTVVLPNAAPLSQDQIASFRTHVDRQIAIVAGMRDTQTVMLD